MLILHPTVESRLPDRLYSNIQTSRNEVSYSRLQPSKALVILHPLMTEEKARVPCVLRSRAIFLTWNLNRNYTMLHPSSPITLHKMLSLLRKRVREGVQESRVRRDVIETRFLCSKLIRWIASNVLKLTISFISLNT